MIIRYLVDDVEAAIEFYTASLGFKLEEQFGPAMAIVRSEEVTLWLAGPQSSAARPMPNGDKPVPGGWNRFVLKVQAIEPLVAKLKSEGVKLKNEITHGPGGSQILCEDPSGNVIELFQPK